MSESFSPSRSPFLLSLSQPPLEHQKTLNERNLSLSAAAVETPATHPHHLSSSFLLKDVEEFIFAAEAGDQKTVLEGISQGFSGNTVNQRGFSALHAAVCGGHTDLLDLFLSMPSALLNQQEKENDETPLLIASLKGQEKMVEKLLKAGADQSITDKTRRTPLHHAALYGRSNIVHLLLTHSNSPERLLEMRDLEGHSALYVSCIFGHNDVVKMLLTAKADPNPIDFSKRTLLDVCLALPNPSPSVLSLLLSFGAVKQHQRCQR